MFSSVGIAVQHIAIFVILWLNRIQHIGYNVLGIIWINFTGWFLNIALAAESLRLI